MKHVKILSGTEVWTDRRTNWWYEYYEPPADLSGRGHKKLWICTQISKVKCLEQKMVYSTAVLEGPNSPLMACVGLRSVIGKRFLPNGPFSPFFNAFEIFNGPFLIILHRLLWAIFQVNGTMAHGPLPSQSLTPPKVLTLGILLICYFWKMLPDQTCFLEVVLNVNEVNYKNVIDTWSRW